MRSSAKGRLVLTGCIGVLVTTLLIVFTGPKETVRQRMHSAGREALSRAVDELWGEFTASHPQDIGRLRAFADFLDERGLEAGTDGQMRVFALDAASDTNPDDDIRLGAVELERRDHDDEIRFKLRIPVVSGDFQDFVESEWVVAPRRFEGADFALLANNVNCLMCHTSIDNAARVFNRDPALRGSFQRVRIGTLESLNLRTATSVSRIAGTIYTRGRVTREDGQLLSSLVGTQVSAARFDAQERIIEDSEGRLENDFFRVSSTWPPIPLQNFYADYPHEPELQADGPFPSRFPSPFPELDADPGVSDLEFRHLAERADGLLDGGFKAVVKKGQIWLETQMPRVDVEPVLGSVVHGNLLLRGTPENPLHLRGRLLVDGDVVITGPVVGSGFIQSRGNMYIVGPTTYLDIGFGTSERRFGRSKEGLENRLVLAAGGHVVAGDILATLDQEAGKSEVSGTRAGLFNFTLAEMMLFNRMEWTKVQPTLRGARGIVTHNPHFQPGSRPRYYVLKKGNPVFIFNNPETADIWFHPNTGSWCGVETPSRWHFGGWKEYQAAELEAQGATVMPLLPDKWLPIPTYRALLTDAASEHIEGTPFQIDALMYTRHALMMMVMRSSRYAGTAVINGAVIAADVGILAPGTGDYGLYLNWDARVAELFEVRDYSNITLVERR